MVVYNLYLEHPLGTVPNYLSLESFQSGDSYLCVMKFSDIQDGIDQLAAKVLSEKRGPTDPENLAAHDIISVDRMRVLFNAQNGEISGRSSHAVGLVNLEAFVKALSKLKTK